MKQPQVEIEEGNVRQEMLHFELKVSLAEAFQQLKISKNKKIQLNRVVLFVLNALNVLNSQNAFLEDIIRLTGRC